MKVIRYVDKNIIENIKKNIKDKEEQISILIKLLEWYNHEHSIIFNKKHKTRKELNRLKVLEERQKVLADMAMELTNELKEM
ncbi:hypothetical protein [Ligilactobacillus cholophilus]|uniref:hypothetical protein n=1 Tax=Ligilactobacillus cholophilus TaxID=3050131 RepID=UPI0025AF9F54|nr:hypothetical protein [Ligilactobacillus cholophilus]